jgi:hypothetical protein
VRPGTTRRSPPDGPENRTPSSRHAPSPDLVANIGIDDATHQFADIIGRLGTAAVIIGDVAVLPR